MSEMENKLNAEQLEAVTGGTNGDDVPVTTIKPRWVEVTASSLNCRYWPDGPIAKIYEKGHRLKVDAVTKDNLWYRLLIYDPKGGNCYGFIYKKYTREI